MENEVRKKKKVGTNDWEKEKKRNVIFFFFQAEDGIRDDLVTGVQTCALPISQLLIVYFVRDVYQQLSVFMIWDQHPRINIMTWIDRKSVV